jgi:hypothetical protein
VNKKMVTVYLKKIDTLFDFSIDYLENEDIFLLDRPEILS